MMEQEWRTDCQFSLHPEQPIIDETKIIAKQACLQPARKCKSAIRWYQNIPVISWLLLRGKVWYLPITRSVFAIRCD